MTIEWQRGLPGRSCTSTESRKVGRSTTDEKLETRSIPVAPNEDPPKAEREEPLAGRVTPDRALAAREAEVGRRAIGAADVRAVAKLAHQSAPRRASTMRRTSSFTVIPSFRASSSSHLLCGIENAMSRGSLLLPVAFVAMPLPYAKGISRANKAAGMVDTDHAKFARFF